MLQRSGDALYSSCAGDNPRTSSATIWWSSGSAPAGVRGPYRTLGRRTGARPNRHTVSVRTSSGRPRSIFLRSMFIGMGMVTVVSRTIPWTVGAKLSHHTPGRSWASIRIDEFTPEPEEYLAGGRKERRSSDQGPVVGGPERSGAPFLSRFWRIWGTENPKRPRGL